ncbi:hypothetical protein FS749_009715 [Ceratobasidium sp. UAMH 11750]|nr:hypothetical protein FS749_009715 [Ceratobasidium sp. UAMH 11750]
MVGWLLLLDTLNSAFGVGVGYRYTITLFGDFAALRHSHWFLNTGPAINATVSSTTQCFFAWRITKLTGHTWIGWTIAASAFIQTLAGVAISVGSSIIVDFARFKELHVPVTVRLVMSSVTDVAITCILSWYLHSHRTGFPRTDNVLSKLIRLTVQTGLLMSLWAVVDLIVFLVVPNNLHLLFSLPLSKLCTNSLMSTLNSRGGWDMGMSIEEGASGAANGISVHVSFMRECDKTTDSSRPDILNNRVSTFARHTMSEASRVCSGLKLVEN